MSPGWRIAAAIFFFASCCFGALLFAGLYGPEGIHSQEWQQTFHPDAGR